VTRVDGALADCFVRLVRLLAMPRAVRVLYPGIMREICYWLFEGLHGGDIAQTMLATGNAEPIVRAIHTLRDRFDQPVRIEQLASVAHLSASAFHRQFKELTSMTPLQYQKQLRLLEARRLMVSDSAGAE
jgi:AraC-like DNA-binding protein